MCKITDRRGNRAKELFNWRPLVVEIYRRRLIIHLRNIDYIALDFLARRWRQLLRGRAVYHSKEAIC